MSSIKTTQIDGDVSVGRNVATGGKLDVAGSATVGHNLKVEGWLEAANIKGANKGIFLTVEELREAYPNPHDGWMAGVGSSTPFTAYVGKGGDWVATGGTIEVTVDMSQYTEGVAQLQEDIDNVKAEVSTNETNITSHTQQLTTLGNQLNSVSETANAAKTQSETNKADITSHTEQLATLDEELSGTKDTVSAVKKDYESFKATKDEPNGLAPLDDDGLVPNENLHDNVFDVLPFAVMTEDVTSDGTLQGKDGDGVAYDTKNKRFYAYEQEDASQPPTKYYANWLTGSHYNNDSEPYTDKIYLYTTTNTLYRFDGTDLVKVGSGLELGHTATTAFPGDEGQTLQDKVETMGDDIGTINGWREEMEESAAAQQELQRADGVVNVNTLLGHASRQVPLTFAQVLTQVWACEYDVKLPGVVLTWIGADGWRSKQWVNCGKQEETDWKTESNWTDYGGERQVALTQDEYDALAAAGTLDADTYYNVLEE